MNILSQLNDFSKYAFNKLANTSTNYLIKDSILQNASHELQLLKKKQTQITTNALLPLNIFKHV